FAQAEQCAEPSNIPARHLRVQEIKDLDQKLKAAETLNNLSYAVNWTDEAVVIEKPQYYLIEFDNEKREVFISPYNAPRQAVLNYDNAEAMDRNNAKNIVLVEADKLENMKAAYPNYFGDVQLFRMQLGRITKGKGAVEYIVKPQETVMP